MERGLLGVNLLAGCGGGGGTEHAGRQWEQQVTNLQGKAASTSSTTTVAGHNLFAGHHEHQKAVFVQFWLGFCHFKTGGKGPLEARLCDLPGQAISFAQVPAFSSCCPCFKVILSLRHE